MIGTILVVLGTLAAILVGFGVSIFGLAPVASLALGVVAIGVGILIGAAPVGTLFGRKPAA